MKKQKVYVFVFDGYSDWEPSYALAELNQSGRFEVITFGVNEQPVTSAGGLKILPSAVLDDELLHDACLLLIPGGKALEEKQYMEIMPAIEYAWRNAIPIAAICGATTLLADLGMLDDIQHTSNALFYLKEMSGWYKGDEFYVESGAVTDGNIITAGGVYPVEFAREIFKVLGLFDGDMSHKWYQLFKNGVWAEEAYA